MSYEPVDMYVRDTTPLANPIEGVVVKVLSEGGALTYGMQSTDANGKVSFLLEAPLTYQVRFFKLQASIQNPKYISVLEAPETNVFDVTGEIFATPVSTNPRLCMASGYFKRLDGQPAGNVDMHFIARFNPLLLENDAVLTERISIRTDKRGYASVPLIRFGMYTVMVEGFDDVQRLVSVPDLPNVNLPDLLFPRVASISMDPAGPYALIVGEELVLTPTVTTSDGRQLDGSATAEVRWSSSDTVVLAVLPSAGTITLRALASGAAQIICERNDSSIIRIPNTPISGQPLDVTVT